MERVKVKIERETKKAYLIAAGNHKGWIQKRWLRSDSTVSVKTFENAVKNYNEQESSRKEAKQFANEYHKILGIEKETEKAIAVKLVLDFCDVEKTQNKLLWIPKSLIKDGAVQGWYVTKKMQEILDEYRMDFSRYGSVIIDSVAVADFENRGIYAM